MCFSDIACLSGHDIMVRAARIDAIAVVPQGAHAVAGTGANLEALRVRAHAFAERIPRWCVQSRSKIPIFARSAFAPPSPRSSHGLATWPRALHRTEWVSTRGDVPSVYRNPTLRRRADTCLAGVHDALPRPCGVGGESRLHGRPPIHNYISIVMRRRSWQVLGFYDMANWGVERRAFEGKLASVATLRGSRVHSIGLKPQSGPCALGPRDQLRRIVLCRLQRFSRQHLRQE